MREATMPFFGWNDELSLGVSVIDAEHKSLVVLLNHLYEAVKSNSDFEIVGKALDALIEEMSVHFEHEEDLFWKTGFPDGIRHKLVHEQILGQFCRLRNIYRDNKVNLSTRMVAGIAENIVDHIKMSDKKFGQFLKEGHLIASEETLNDARLAL